MKQHFERRDALLALLGIGSIAGVSLSPTMQRAIAAQAETQTDALSITPEQIANASWIVDAKLTPQQCDEVAKDLNRKINDLKKLHESPPLEDVPMPLAFRPSFFVSVDQGRQSKKATPSIIEEDWKQGVELPRFSKLDDVIDWSLPQLALGLRQRVFSSQQLTEFYSNRLRKANESLLCVVNMNDKAMEQARQNDEELSNGIDRGILHGIPWGAKDIIAVPELPTTWGVGRYEKRTWATRATVASKIEQAGGVLLAKLSVGTLAWGDEWFGGTTKNPWNTEQGSSGSSAGSASAVAARLCPFALGSETLGSIVSPTRVCATSGLRPTFGRVSRAGCMTLAWSMDKIGPIANRVEDCAIVFRTLLGIDNEDPTVVEQPFVWPMTVELKGLKVGVPRRLSRSEEFVRNWLESQGAELIPISFSASPTVAMLEALSVEAASVHDKLFRTASEDKEIGKWGPSFRSAQWVRAIDYLHGMRERVAMIRDSESELSKVDILIGDGNLARMNLTGHPSLVVAFGKELPPEPIEGETRGVPTERRFVEKPNTVVLTGRMFSESMLLAVGCAIQKAHPPMPSSFS